MANEFKVKNGLIVIGDLTTSGTITINGALAATQSWVASQGYLTSASLSGYATQSYVTSAISSLIDAAPAALDTLNELAAALGDDANFSTTITNSIASKQAQLNGTGLVRMSGTSVSYDNSTYLISNFGNIEGEHSYGYPSSEGWYKIAEIVLTSSCQSFNLWGEYRDTGYFDNSHYRIHITARAECDFPTNNESHAINVNMYGSSTNETYFNNNVRVVLTSSSSNYRKYELQYYRATWDTGSWNLQTLGWTTYTTSQTAGTPTGTPRVYYISKFVADNIYAANKISIGTTYSGFAANIAGTTYVIGASVWVNDGYGISNASSGGTGFFPYSDGNSVINSNNTTRLFVNGSTGNIGIGTSSPSEKLQVAGNIKIQNETGLITDYGPLIGRYNTSQIYIGTGGSYSIIKIGRDDGSALNVLSGGTIGIGTTSPVATLSVVGTVNLGAQASGFYNTNSVLHIAKSGVAQITFEDYQVTAGIAVAASVMSFGNQVSDATYRFKYNNIYNGNFASTGTTLVQFNPTTSYISTGNVGIGTTSPDTPLVVQGGSAGTGGWNRTATLSATYPGLIFNSNGTKWGGMAYDYSAAMRFWVNASNNDIFAGTLAMSILNNGNVGIGTSDPGAKLHVVGNAWINRPSNKVDNASCTELPSRVEFNNAFASGASGYTVFTYPTPSVFRIYGDYDGNIGGLQPDLQLGLGYLTVKNSGGTMGNVGIGTTSPAAKLHVVGNTYIQSGALFVDTIGGYTTNLISLAASTNVLVPSGDITIGSGASTGTSQPFGDFSQLKFDNLHSDTNRGPNKIVMHDNGSAWIGGFGIHSDTVSYYTGGHHRWYKTDSQTSSNQVMQLDASGNLSITGTFSASGYNNSNWNTAYGWGNHASAGYLTSETDTLASVTARGSSTSTAVTFNGGVNLAANTGIRKSGDNWIIGYDTSLPGIAIGSGTVTDKVSISSGGTQRVWFDTNGKVGIGTSTPAEELHVIGRGIFNGGSGNSSQDAVVYITKSTNDDWGLYVNNAGLDYGMYTRVSPSANYAFAIHNGTSWTTRITGDGRVYLNEKDTIASYDGWLRLNSSAHYTSGVYTPYALRNDGAFDNYGGIYGYNTIRARKLQTVNNYTTAALWTESYDLTTTGIAFHISGIAGKFLEMRTNGVLYWENSQVWTASTDGSGSGLDADLLDGQNSTEFLRLLSGGAEANLDSYTDNGFRSVSFPGYSQHLLSWNAGGSAGTVQQLFHYNTPNNGWRIRNKTDNSSWSDWGYVVMASSNQGLISGTIATQSYVNTQISNLVNGAPGALDTLNELATALGNDASFATTVTNSIAGKVSKAGDTMTGNLTLAGGTNILFTGGSHAIAGNNTGYLHFYDYTNVYFNNQLVIRGGIQNDGGNVLIDDNLNVAGELAFPDGGGAYTNIIRSAAYPSEGYPAGLNFWMEYRARGGHHFILNTDGGVGAGLASMDDFVVWQGAIDGNRLLEVSNIGNLWIAGSLTEASSLKLKENVETSEGNLEKVVNLRPVTYNKIGSETTELGLIAEEVAEVYPEFVQYDENGEPIGVNYSRLTAALIGAVKELTNQVQELNKKING